MGQEQSMSEFRKSVDWERIYHSKEFRRLKSNRMRFVVPAIIAVCMVFLFLWTVQSYIPALANVQLLGFINFSFLLTMILFPTIWLAGFAYTKYVERYVEPYEEGLLKTYGKKEAGHE
ncbi:MAG: DUF485 domain-containing protein [Coriobacteriales bacterium]|jgi:uncharacterized membrane protein (DUF485 family)|nr:DUF485 domain-containing protein [Coriobacteriales bacterium]